MKLFRSSHTNRMPDWMGAHYEEEERKTVEANTYHDLRINATSADKVNDIVLAEECDEIEKCAGSSTKYFLNGTWSDSDKDHLREFAMAVGVQQDQIVEMNGADVESVIATAKTEAGQTMQKTASTETKKSTPSAFDPFKLDSVGNLDHMDSAEWEQVQAAEKYSGTNSMLQGTFAPIRGGESYDISPTNAPADGQNSIVRPDAIEQLAQVEEKDTGVRLREEKQAREDLVAQEKVGWEERLVQQMKDHDACSKGSVFPTESMNAQPGLGNPSSQMGVYAEFSPDDIPDRTLGEQLGDIQAKRKASIQRDEKENEWEKPSRESRAEISDVFAESLKKQLKK